MSQNDSAVLTAAVGYIYTAPVGHPRPSPDQISTGDPEAYGAQTHSLKVTGTATAGTFTLNIPTFTAFGGDAVEVGPAIEVDPGAGVETPVAEVAGQPKSASKATKPVDAAAGEAVPAVDGVVPAAGGVTGPINFDATASDVQYVLERVPGIGSGSVKVSGKSLKDGYTIAWIGIHHGKTIVMNVGTNSLTGTTPVPVVAVVSAAGGWDPLGHTSRDDLPEFGYDGGDKEIRGTWQNESLREVTTKPVEDYLTMLLQQFDTQSFELYYGKDASPAAGVFGVANSNPVAVEKALLVVVVDGDTKIAFYAPKASLRRDDSISLATDEFASLPVRATFLKHGSVNKFEWISKELFL